MTRYRVYGVSLETELPFSWPIPAGSGPPDLHFELVDAPPEGVDPSGAPSLSEARGRKGGGPSGREEGIIAYHRRDGLDVVRIRDTAEHYLYPDRILCHLHNPGWRFLAEIQLLGIVLALWLERRGVPVLHASAVVVDEAAVAFLGAKRGGKTTAATALVAAGYPLLVDDLLALDLGTGPAMAQPGYPMLRLEPDQADHFLGGHESLPLVHPDFTKRKVFLEKGFGAFHPHAVPLRKVYIPVRVPDPTAPVAVEPLGARDALFALLQHSYLRDVLHSMGLAQGRLPALSDGLSHLRVSVLRYPDGFEHLPALVEAVERDLSGG